MLVCVRVGAGLLFRRTFSSARLCRGCSGGGVVVVVLLFIVANRKILGGCGGEVQVLENGNWKPASSPSSGKVAALD